MKVADFLTQLKKAANSTTLYVMGGFGAPAGYGNNRNRYKNNNAYNRQDSRQKKINAATPDTYFFDCVGLVKGVLWDWNALPNRIYGGADYGSNGVPDYDAKQMCFSGCRDAGPITGALDPGEFLWFNGHCGIYLGDGKTIECTPSWNDGVQIRDMDNRWTHHGHLNYVEYGAKPQPTPTPEDYKPGNMYTVTCTGPLRVRKGPSTSDYILENLYKGDKVICEDVVKTAGGSVWLKVTGYVAAKFDGEVYINGD